MDATPRDSKVLLRRGLKSPPGVFEKLIRELVREHAGHLEIEWVMPDPEDGPGQTFNRDNAMVAKADLVLAFFAPYHPMEGGTGHVVEAAIDRNVPVYSWEMGNKGLTRVGDHDPDALWQEMVAEYFDRTD